MYGCMYVCMDGWMDVTRPFPLAFYCSKTVGTTVTKFSQIVGTMHPFVVLKLGPLVTDEVPLARANVRHWVYIGRPLLSEMHVHRQQWAQIPGLQN